MARREMGKLTFLDLVDRSGPDPAHRRAGGRALARRHRRRDRPAGALEARRAVAGDEPGRAAGEDPQAAAGHLPRRHRPRDALPAALPRPADERGVARARGHADEDRRGRARLPRWRGLHRGRDADPAAALRRRLRRAVRDPLE